MKKRLQKFTHTLALALTLCAFTAAPIALSGCKSAATAAYKTTGVTAATVDASMRAWGDYVTQRRAAGMSAAETSELDAQRLAVSDAFTKYQLALRAITDAGVAYAHAAANPSDPSTPAAQQALVTASTVLGAAITDLTNLLLKFGVQI